MLIFIVVWIEYRTSPLFCRRSFNTEQPEVHGWTRGWQSDCKYKEFSVYIVLFERSSESLYSVQISNNCYRPHKEIPACAQFKFLGSVHPHSGAVEVIKIELSSFNYCGILKGIDNTTLHIIRKVGPQSFLRRYDLWHSQIHQKNIRVIWLILPAMVWGKRDVCYIWISFLFFSINNWI